MASSFAISRAHLVYGVCLPLAVLVGYFLAEPLESGSVAVVVLVLAVLSIPVFLRWHHPLLIGSLNASCFLFFFPGRPYLWMMLAGISLFFSLLNRSMGQKLNFFAARSVARSLLFLVTVVVVTAYATGGIGLRSFGGDTFGGKKYVYVFAGVVAYFALAGERIPPSRAKWFMALFFLSGLASLLGYLSYIGGSGFEFLAALFPVEDISTKAANDFVSRELFRLGSLGYAVTGVFSYSLCRHGISGLLEMKRPWRLALFGLVLVGALACGFRSILILLLVIFAILFCLEGLARTRYLLVILAGGLLVSALTLPFVHKMPLSMQRTLSFLPINVDPLARESAQASTEWRLDMWMRVLPEVPKHLIKGKGYAIDPGELYMAFLSGPGGFAGAEAGSIVAGDYHNGILSLIIPFGLFGVGAFIWFISASVSVLKRNYRYGDPSLKLINRFLLAYFLSRLFMFVFIFGSLYSDLITFTAIIGLSVSLNGGAAERSEAVEVAESVESLEPVFE